MRDEAKRVAELERSAGLRYKALFDAVADPLFIVDRTSQRFLDCNRAASQTYGYAHEEFLEMTVFDLHPREDWDAVRENVEAVDDNSPHTYRHVTKWGSLISVEIRTEQFEHEGQPAWISVVREITDRSLAGAALQESEERYRHLITMAPEAIYVLREGRIVFINGAGARLLGADQPPDVAGLSIAEFVHPDYLKLAQRRLEKVSREGQVPPVHAKFIRRDGLVVDVEVAGARIVFRGEEAVQVVARDISQRIRQEEGLRLEKAYFERLFESAPQAIVLVDNDGRISRANQEFFRLFGFAESELSGRSVDELIAPGELRDDAASITSRVAAGQTVALETRRKKQDGTLVDVAILGAPIVIGGQQVGVYGIYTDVTERKRLEEQLRQSHKMEAIGQLAGGIAHDFNNLLTAILGNCEILLGDLDSRDPNYLDVEEIKRAGERAASLTRQLLAFSRRQYLRPKVIDLNVVIADTEKMLARLIGENIELVTTLDPNLRHVRADPGQIEQVIVNLAVNARDAMPDGGRLAITTFNIEVRSEDTRIHRALLPGHYAMMSVSDTGIGMSPEIQSRMFEPFFTTKDKGRGTGLGLSTVYGIVKQSGGHIWVESEVGRGTSFLIHLPEIDADAESPQPASEQRDLLGGSETIMLVEDEEVVRNLLDRVLERLGYNVLHARNGDDALALSERYAGEIDLLVTDMIMPGMNGSVLAERLMGSRPAVKVLYMSGYLDTMGRKGALGPDAAFLQKPFTPETLARRVREVLDR